MNINKLIEFAKEGDRSINGLSLITGFPRQQKPYRQWMNYLFNSLSSKTNEIIDEVNNINESIKPLFEPIAVGEGFFTVNDYQSPSEVAELKGYGTWQRFAEGRTLVGYSSDDSNPDEYRSMGNEFGENKHKLTIEEMPKHNHPIQEGGDTFVGSGGQIETGLPRGYIEAESIGNRGGDQPHNNIQPSIVVAYWLRTN